MTLVYRHCYATKRSFYNASMQRAASLPLPSEDDAHDCATGKLCFSGRRVHAIATYGSWTIRYYEPETPAFGTDDPALDGFYDATGPKGLSRGYDDLSALLADLREWDARSLPPCTC